MNAIVAVFMICATSVATEDCNERTARVFVSHIIVGASCAFPHAEPGKPVYTPYDEDTERPIWICVDLNRKLKTEGKK